VKSPKHRHPTGWTSAATRTTHSLIPRGWQRAGALGTLFAPFGGQHRSGLATPGQLISPNYGDPTSTAVHRTYETIYPLSQLIAVDIENPYAEGEEQTLGQTVATATDGVALICWEHTAIPTIANNILPIAAGTQIPQTWPGARFDVVWSFAYDTNTSEYVFSQLPQMVLAGDSS
jgi:hypothetical protein